MRIDYRPNGEASVTGYEAGDLVVLLANEPGDFGTARTGDWGKVAAVDSAGRLTITLAGFSLPHSAPLRSISDIPPRIVMPCDRRGKPQAPRSRAYGPVQDWASR
jgi:hypothetical protein